MLLGRKKIVERDEMGMAPTLDEGIEDLEGMMEEMQAEKASERRVMSGGNLYPHWLVVGDSHAYRLRRPNDWLTACSSC
jgi:hypothetical protein